MYMTPKRAIVLGVLLGLLWFGTAHAIPPITLLGTSQSSVANTTGSFNFALPSQYSTATSVTVIGVCATSGTDDPTGNTPLTSATITCPAGWTEKAPDYLGSTNWLASSPFSASTMCYRFYNAGDPANVTISWTLSSSGFAVASALTYTGVQYSPAVEADAINQFGGTGENTWTSTFPTTLTAAGGMAVGEICGHVFDRAAPQVTGVGIHIPGAVGATLETEIKNANVNGPISGLADKDNTFNVPCGPGNCNMDGDFPFPTATPTAQFPFVNWANGILEFENGTPSPSPTPTPTPSPTPSPTATPSASPTPSPTPTGTAAPTQTPQPVVTPFVCQSSWPNCIIVQHGIPFGPTPNGGNIKNPGIFLEQPPPFTATYPGNDYCCSVVYPCTTDFHRCLCEWHSNTCYYVEPFDPFHFR